MAKTVINFGYFPGAAPLTEFRYWRVLVQETNEADLSDGITRFVGLTYIGLVDAITGEDIVDPADYLNGTGSTDEAEMAYNAFKGPSNTLNAVVSKGAGGLYWYQYDFGALENPNIYQVLMRVRADGFRTQSPRRFVLQGSHDTTTWFDRFIWDVTSDPLFIWTREFIARLDGNPKPADPGKLVPHKHWRIRTTSYNDPDYITFRNIKYYSDVAMTSTIGLSGAVLDSSEILEGTNEGAYGDPGNRMTGRHSDFPYAFTVEFSTAQFVRGMSMSSRAAFGGQSADTLSVDYSDDGQNWYESWAIPSQAPWGEDDERFFADPDPAPEPPGSYWRIYGTLRQKTITQWAEMEWLATSGGTDLLNGGNASAFSEYSGSYVASYLCDNVDGTSWASNGGSGYPWWQYKFISDPGDVEFVRFKGNSFSATESWQKATLEKSDDGITWTLYGDIDIPPAANATWTAELPVTPIPPIVKPTTPHRYWRFNIREGGSNFQSVIEAELLDSGGTDLTSSVGGTASANVAQGGYPASRAFDDNTSTRWYDNGYDGRWIQWDFGSGNDQLPVKWSLQCAANAPGGWELMYSDDGSTWTVADRRLRLTWSSDRKEWTIP